MSSTRNEDQSSAIPSQPAVVDPGAPSGVGENTPPAPVCNSPLNEQVIAARAKRRNEMYRLILAFAVFASAMFIIFMALRMNPGVYKLDEQTVRFLSEAFNAGILLTIPFLLGAVGAVTRLLLSGVRIVEQLPLVGGSSFMACFSWISIKSGVLVSLVAPHLAPHGVDMKDALSTPNSFYTMALVAILVGMFSTNLHLFITHRVEQLSNQSPKSREPRG